MLKLLDNVTFKSLMTWATTLIALVLCVMRLTEGQVVAQQKMSGLETVQQSRLFKVHRFTDEKDRTCYILDSFGVTGTGSISCVK